MYMHIGYRGAHENDVDGRCGEQLPKSFTGDNLACAKDVTAAGPTMDLSFTERLLSTVEPNVSSR